MTKEPKGLMIKHLWRNYNHFLILGYYLVLGFIYSTFNKAIVPEYYIHSVLDDYIPFVKIFVIPYIYWYFYILIPLVYFGFTSREDFIKLAVFMFGGMTICYFIYMLFPNGQQLRPLISDQDFCSRLILRIYGTDRPTNVAPSMHVLDSIAVHLAIINSKLRNKKWIVWGSFISAVTISMSTVLIKQHSIVDGFYAIILSYVLYLAIYKFDWKKRHIKKSKTSYVAEKVL